MNPEAEQPGVPVQEQAAKVPAAKVQAKRKAGVPVWRTGKPDAFLAAAVDAARTAVEGITPAATIGPHVAAKSEGDRLVTHLFESRLPGYAGWQWYAVLTRNSRSKVVTVNELGLLPSEDSILAPEWVPWAERVRPEDAQEAETQDAHGQEPEQEQEPEGDAQPEQEPAGDASGREPAPGDERASSSVGAAQANDAAPADDTAPGNDAAPAYDTAPAVDGDAQAEA